MNVTIEWDHPRHGRIRETACAQHEAEILLATAALGMGCTGERAPARAACLRCAHRGQRPRLFIATAAVAGAVAR